LAQTKFLCAIKLADESVGADLLANDTSKDKTAVKIVVDGVKRKMKQESCP
jgi:hypothetical protein